MHAHIRRNLYKFKITNISFNALSLFPEKYIQEVLIKSQLDSKYIYVYKNTN